MLGLRVRREVGESDDLTVDTQEGVVVVGGGNGDAEGFLLSLESKVLGEQGDAVAVEQTNGHRGRVGLLSLFFSVVGIEEHGGREIGRVLIEDAEKDRVFALGGGAALRVAEGDAADGIDHGQPIGRVGRQITEDQERRAVDDLLGPRKVVARQIGRVAAVRGQIGADGIDEGDVVGKEEGGREGRLDGLRRRGYVRKGDDLLVDTHVGVVVAGTGNGDAIVHLLRERIVGDEEGVSLSVDQRDRHERRLDLRVDEEIEEHGGIGVVPRLIERLERGDMRRLERGAVAAGIVFFAARRVGDGEGILRVRQQIIE